MAEYTQKLVDQSGDFLKKAEAEHAKFEQAMGLLRQEYSTKAAIVLEQIQTHKKSVEKLVGVIGNLGVTSGYQKAANYARTARRAASGDRRRFASLVLMASIR